MDKIREQVKRAHRRLSLELFVNRLLRCWFVTLLLAVAAISAPKIWVLDNLPERWPLICSLVGLGVGLLIAFAWTWLRGRTELEAAVEIDRRYGLKERIASSLSLSSVEAETPAGQALLKDAIRAVGRIDVDEKFKMQLQQRPWLPLVPALLAFGLTMFVDNQISQSIAAPNPTELTQQQQQEATKKLRERMTKRRKEAAEKGLKDAEGLFRELEKQTEKMAKAKDTNRKQNLVKINDLAKQLQKRREQLGGNKQMQKQMQKLNNMNKGPADKMVEAMKKGDWKVAKQELEKLKQQMKDGKLDEKAKKELGKQLEQIQDKLEQAKQAREQAMDDLKKEIQQQKQQGNLSKAGDLQQKLDQMQQKQQQMNKMNDLAKKMGECQQCMKNGDGKGAAKALDDMMQQMDQMQQDMAEGEMLDMAMDQLEMAKEDMGCKQCQGGNQGGQKPGGKGKGDKPGNGMGEGKAGFGPRPDEKNDVAFRDSRVRQKPGRGAAVIAGEADGANIRGQVVESIKAQMATDASKPADPLVVEQLPKSRREHAKEYFDSFRGE